LEFNLSLVVLRRKKKMKNDIFLYYDLIKDLFLGKLDEWFIV
jgi:hypothetical protein